MYPSYSTYSTNSYGNSPMNSYPNALPQYNYPVNQSNGSDDRVGFLAPFLLGGITGGLLAPAFYQRPYYPYPPYYYGPYPRYY